MSECFFVSNAFVCYVATGITCAGCAMANLVNRFKSGNSPRSILFGGAQFLFYVLNICAGVLALFGSEALQGTHITETAFTNLPKALTQAMAFGLATFISLRTTIGTLSNGQKLEFGPGRIFAVLLENIERRIDHNRMTQASKEIKGIAKTLSPRAVLEVVLPYCFDQSETDKSDREEITRLIETIYIGNHNVYPSERSALMLNHLHKIFGIAVLKAAEELVSGEDLTPQTSIDTETSSALKFTESKLDRLLDQLRTNDKPGGA